MGELDRRVCERLGYHTKIIDTNPMTDRQLWGLLAPDGAIVDDGHAVGWMSEDEIWERFAPPFSRDVALALTLVPEWTPERTFMLRLCDKGWRAAITDVALHPEGGAFESVSNTPAEAICGAWLEWVQHAPVRRGG